MTPSSFQFQYHTGKNLATFMVRLGATPGRENALHIYIEEDENISEFFAVPKGSGDGRSMVIYRAITDLPIWLHATDVLGLIMREIDKMTGTKEVHATA